jgi:hypothetical protein
MKIKAMIAEAIDRDDARLAGRAADLLRGNGFKYRDILALVHEVRPACTDAAWDELLAESEEA